jgi:DNA-binding SARP family transcriptional activator
MLPTMEIRLFGAPALILNGQPVTGFISNKAPALIYYVAAMEHAQMRELVATLLWTNTPELDAKRNLRTVLSNLRTVLGPFLEITRTTIRLKTESVALLDSASFVAKVKAAEQATADSSQRSALFAEAAALYRGPFLEGFSIREAEAFEAWLRQEREYLHRLALQALGELTAYYAHQGELLSAINTASRLLRLDPTREETHRRLMLMFALDGQRSAALAQYQACQAILRQEVASNPIWKHVSFLNAFAPVNSTKIPRWSSCRPPLGRQLCVTTCRLNLAPLSGAR